MNGKLKSKSLWVSKTGLRKQSIMVLLGVSNLERSLMFTSMFSCGRLLVLRVGISRNLKTLASSWLSCKTKYRFKSLKNTWSSVSRLDIGWTSKWRRSKPKLAWCRKCCLSQWQLEGIKTMKNSSKAWWLRSTKLRCVRFSFLWD